MWPRGLAAVSFVIGKGRGRTVGVPALDGGADGVYLHGAAEQCGPLVGEVDVHGGEDDETAVLGLEDVLEEWVAGRHV
jgi:hypothetical protein